MTRLSRYLHPPLRRPWWSYAGAVVLIAGAAWAGHDAWVTRLATQAVLARLEVEEARRIASVPVPPTRLELEQKKQWEELTLERSFDWNGVFLALQHANHPGIELLEFRPEKRQGVIVLRGEARSVAALSEYLQKISAQPAFKQIYLTRQDLRAHGQLETVGFEIRGTMARP